MSVNSHSLQAALLAEDAGYEDSQIVAAFLHDIGHLLHEVEKSKVDKMGEFGIVDHELIGAQYLESIGFEDKICVPIANHVKSKRYLCAIDKSYYDELSDASVQTLNYQGGPMSKEEVETFENEDYFTESVALRKLDDQAKIENFKIDNIRLKAVFDRIEKYV
ncbi:UNVERIFIED_CONTAM: hypothetical protein GTU68_037663 [Idotea baltica]|nr:hypothetical protein [Idotea baltica]